ncbi:NmrA-like family protein-like protein [Hyaloscypha variabilis]
MSQPIAVIIGATGGQGGSVVDSFLKDGKYQVRAVTRNVNSANAQALHKRGVEVVTADLNDQASLIQAFKGATLIFAVTDFFEPFAAKGPEYAIQVEAAQGINLAKAAAATPTLKHYIWSTLPNGKKISGGKYIIPHFEAKNQIDAYIKSDPALLPKTTFVWVTFFASNLFFPMFTPNLIKSSGKYVWLQPAPADTPILSVGDQKKNVGPIILAVANKPELTLNGKFVLATVDESTAAEFLSTWGRVTGKQTEYSQISLEEYNRLWPMWGQEMGIMMEFWGEYKDKSWSGEDFIRKEDLGVVGKLVTTEEAVASFDYSSVL